MGGHNRIALPVIGHPKAVFKQSFIGVARITGGCSGLLQPFGIVITLDSVLPFQLAALIKQLVDDLVRLCLRSTIPGAPGIGHLITALS